MKSSGWNIAGYFFAFAALCGGAMSAWANRPPNQEPHHYLATGSIVFSDRVWAQTQIMRADYSHQLWPNQNTTPKPSFEEAVPSQLIREKVRAIEQKENSLTAACAAVITPAALQAEMDRWGVESQAPDQLQELFAALNFDAFLVAQTLARPILIDQQAAIIGCISNGGGSGSQQPPNRDSFNYQLPVLAPPGGCNTWTAMNTAGAPPLGTANIYKMAVVETGTMLLVWDGNVSGSPTTGLGYNFVYSTGNWSSINSTTPYYLNGNLSVWTGSLFLVYGSVLSDKAGYAYEPNFDRWTAIPPPTNNVPVFQDNTFNAEWTGSEMILTCVRLPVFTGPCRALLYNPVTGLWRISTDQTVWASETYPGPVAWCDGTQSIYRWNSSFNAMGAHYYTANDYFISSTQTSAPSLRDLYSLVCDGYNPIIWSGVFGGSGDNSGAIYHTATDSWTPTALSGAPIARGEHAAVWSGGRMIVWGGAGATNTVLNSGGRYNPDTDTWLPTSLTGAPAGRRNPYSFWIESLEKMIVWGGYKLSGGTSDVIPNTGGFYSLPAPTIVTPPTSQSICGNMPFSLSVAATSATFKWWYLPIDGLPVDLTSTSDTRCTYTGAASANLTVNCSSNPANAFGKYYAVASDSCNSIRSNFATVTPSLNIITQQPVSNEFWSQRNESECAADFYPHYTFTVSASGSGLSYRWQRLIANVWTDMVDTALCGGGVPDPNCNGFTGTKTPTLGIHLPGCADQGKYRVRINNGTCTEISATASFTARKFNGGALVCCN